MTNGNWHQIWVEQCVAAETIKLRYGLKAAFDYAVAEKLLNFAEAAAQHHEFARELSPGPHIPVFAHDLLSR